MSRENVETLRRGLEALDRRDRAAWLAQCEPDLEVVASGAWPDAEVIRGPEPAWDFYTEVLEAFEDFASADAELVDAGAGKVLVHSRHDLRGKASGAAVQFDYWVVVTYRDGKRHRDEWFADRADALEAAGLRE
ncbi:MAG TPA: nuclear transport factor 2 family protein [Thermoleophilaceae bacterium]|nr:nuclear transport factor 2 family protein [Thermoleophilaceae bacterium]